MASDRRRPTPKAEAAGHETGPALSTLSSEPSYGCGESRALDRLVDEATARITRLDAPEAFSASAAGAVIIDIRSQDGRELQGVIPGSLHIPRTVLEWRVAVGSPWRNPHLGGLDQQLMLICDHGYSSILAASNLVQLGFCRAGDVIGGFEAWKLAGLPITPCRHRLSVAGMLPGLGPPEHADEAWTAGKQRSQI